MLPNFLTKLKKSTKLLLILIGVVILVGVFIPGKEISADFFGIGEFSEKAVLTLIGWVASLIISFLGALLGWVISLLVLIAEYNHFIDAKAPPAIHIGWGVVRDFSNMLFIIGLMVIAFGTILKIQTFHARNALVKLIIMAILINFSKTITGIFIDFSQVAMLTFVNAFKDSAPIILAVGLNLKGMISLAEQGGAGLIEVIVSMLLAVIMLVVAIATIFAMAVVLLYRIIMIWLLVILSPIAYIATVLPNTQKYSSAWWGSLGKNLISGPLLAFFLWLALSVISTSAGQPISFDTTAELGEDLSAVPLGASGIMTTQNMFNYVVTISLLIMGLMMTQSLGVLGGQITGNTVNRLRSAGVGAVTGAVKGAGKSYAWGARKIKAGQAPGLLKHLKGVDFDPTSIYRTMKAGFARKKEQEVGEGMVKAGERLEKGGFVGALGGLGAASWVDNYAQGFLYQKGVRQAIPFVGKGRKAKITDMYAEKAKQEKKVEDLKAKAEEKNSPDAYREARETEKVDLKGVIGGLNAEINSLDEKMNAPQILADQKKLQAQKLLKDAAESFKKKEITQGEYDKTKEKSKEILDEAAQLRTQRPEDYDRFAKRKGELEAEMVGKNREVEKIDFALKHFDKLKDPAQQQQMARDYLRTAADRRKAEINRIKNGGLTEEQQKARDVEIENIDLTIEKLDIDIKNKKTGGEDASVQERRKGELRDERDKKKYKDNKGNEILNATQEEKKKNEDEIKRLQEEEKELEDASTREYISEDQREIFYREAEKENKELQKMKSQITEEAGWRPIDFLAQQERRSANQESSKKYDTTNEDELIAYKQNAIRRDNVTDAAAVCLQAARVSHLNELINTTKATEDWYEDSETGEMTTKAKEGSRLVFKAGDELSAGIEGLHVFVKEIFEKKFNYGKQASLALENDLSNIAESVSHWTFGQAVGSRPDGQFYQRKREEQQTRCYTERSKRDFEKLYREGNRLSIGTEEWIDQKDHSKGRKAIVNEYAAMEMMNKWDKLKSLADRGRFNVSASEHLMQFNKPLIDRIQQSAYSTGREGDWRKFYGDLQSLGGKAGEVRDLTNAIRDMNKMLKGINLLKQR